MLSVLLDATAVPTDRGGVGRYVDNLIPALAGTGITVEVVCKPQDVEHYGALSGRDPISAGRLVNRAPSRLTWEQAALPRLVRRLGPDVVHSPHYTHPLRGARPLVITLHDATFFTDPGVHTRTKGPFFRAATRLALRNAEVCIVPSQATADELVIAAGATRARLCVAHHGVDTAVFTPPTPAAVSAVRAALGLPPRWITFLGTLEPRKNVPALVGAWVQAMAGRADPPALVLAGGSGWDDEIDAAVTAVPEGLTLIRAGFVPLSQVAGLLGGAELVAYPSLGEGFGLPVLEAMACGAPTLTTRRLALPEVGGDAVAYTDIDRDSIAIALTGLLDDPARRASLRTAGLARAAGFTWDACAAAHLAAYEQAVAVRR